MKMAGTTCVFRPFFAYEYRDGRLALLGIRQQLGFLVSAGLRVLAFAGRDQRIGVVTVPVVHRSLPSLGSCALRYAPHQHQQRLTPETCLESDLVDLLHGLDRRSLEGE